MSARRMILFCFCLVIACGSSSRRSTMRSFDESSANEEVTFQVDEQFEIALSENPTTGYRWRVTGDSPAICTMTSDRFDTTGSTPGSGGTHRWFFRAVREGKGAIALEKSRSFEKAGPAQRFRLTIRVVRG